MTHPFRPIPGNAVFCADCPPGDSVAEKGTARHVGESIPVAVAVLALKRVPTEALVQELRRRDLSHGTHNALRSYQDNEVCYVCGRSMFDVVGVHGTPDR